MLLAEQCWLSAQGGTAALAWHTATAKADLYTAFLSAKSAALREAGGDPQWGRHVPSALRAAGLVDIDVRPFVEVRHSGSASLQLQLHHTHHPSSSGASSGGS